MALRLLAVVVVATSFLTGCPSKDSQASSGATSPSGAPTGSAAGSGPLAGLEAAPFVNETWIAQEGGAQTPFVYWGQQNVRLSAQCRPPNGPLSCDAIRQLRGAPVEIPKKSLTGNVSAGTRVCMKLGHTLWSAHNASGAEDGFCKFPDGSMVSTGALEQYALRVVE